MLKEGMGGKMGNWSGVAALHKYQNKLIIADVYYLPTSAGQLGTN
jgi:hypothetical protein